MNFEYEETTYFEKPKRGIRRAHRKRLRAKRKNNSNLYKNHEHQLDIAIDTPKMCGCNWCRNPRHSKFNKPMEKITMQEKRQIHKDIILNRSELKDGWY